MGYLRKRGKKKYQIVIELEPDPDDSRNFIYKTVEMKKTKAKELMQDMEKDLREGTYVDNDLTLEEHLQDFLDSQKKKLKPRTYNSYKMIIERHIIPALGQYKLKRLIQEPKLIDDYYDYKLKEGSLKNKNKGLSNRTVRYHHSILKRAFHIAIKWRRMKINPADLVTKPEKVEKEAKYLTVEQLNKILELEEIKYYERIYRFAARSGMRKGEILGLEWSEVDFDKEEITIQQSLQRVENEGLVIQKWTKNNQIRIIPMSIKVKMILKQIRAEQSKEELLLNKKNKYNLVFAKNGEVPVTPNYVYRRFKQHCRKAGYDEITFHSLRHTFASLLKQNGVDTQTIQKLLGHKTQSITADIYSHISSGMKKEAAEKIDKIF